MDRGGKYLFYSWNDNGASSVRIRNLQTNKVDIFRGLPRGVVGTGSFSSDGSASPSTTTRPRSTPMSGFWT